MGGTDMGGTERDKRREGNATHLGDDLDVHIGGLLGRVGRRSVAVKGVGGRGLASFGFVGDLLSCRPLPLLSGLCLGVVLAVGGERAQGGGSGRMLGRVGSIARHGRLAGGGMLVGGSGMRGHGMVAAAVVDWVVMNRLVVSLSLLGDVKRRGIAGPDGDRLLAVGAHRLGRRDSDSDSDRGPLWLGGVIDDDNLLGESISVESIPIGFPGSPSLALWLDHGLGGEDGGHVDSGIWLGSSGREGRGIRRGSVAGGRLGGGGCCRRRRGRGCRRRRRRCRSSSVRCCRRRGRRRKDYSI